MADELTKLPIEQRRKFCELLLADMIENWCIVCGTPPTIVITHKDYSPYLVNANGKVFPLTVVPCGEVTRFFPRLVYTSKPD